MLNQEVVRSALQDLELLEDAIAKRLQRNPDLVDIETKLKSNKKRSHRQMLNQQLELAKFVEQYKRQCGIIETTSFDEITEADFDKEYEILKASDDRFYHEDIYSMYGTSKKNIMSRFAADIDCRVMFDDEENLGRFVNMTSFHEKWCTMHKTQMTYVEFLKGLPLKSSKRLSKEYQQWVRDIVEYLFDFYSKVYPLKELKMPSWEYLTSEKRENGVFCFACDKLFKETVYEPHLNGKRHLKMVEKTRDIAYQEFQLEHVLSLLSEKMRHTVTNVEKRSTLTERERYNQEQSKQEELDEDDASGEEEEEEHTEPVDNPLGIPLGPDGLPIPFWLYKLHGLGHEFSCEICSGYVYHGRKEFEAHFFDSRHVNGLKCLGITMSPVYKNITDIKEAQQLSQQLNKKVVSLDVEVEDDDGNVMTKQVYEDLQKQGLL